MTNQSDLQKQARLIARSATSGTYNENLLAVAKDEGATAGNYNGAMIQFLRGRLNVSDGTLSELQAEFASKFGFDSWNQCNQLLPDDYEMWLDGDDESNMTVLPSNMLRGWLDKSPNDNDAIQTNSSLQPTFNSTGANSKGIVEYNADVSPTLKNFDLSNGIMVFVAVTSTTGSAAQTHIFGQWNATGNNRQFFVGKDASNNFNCSFSANGTNEFTVTGDPIADNQVIVFAHNGAAGGIYQNGVLKGASINGINTSGTENFVVGGLNSSTADFVGDIAAVMVFERVLTDDERNQVERYLINKYDMV